MLGLITELRGGMRSRPLDAPSTFQIVSMLHGDTESKSRSCTQCANPQPPRPSLHHPSHLEEEALGGLPLLLVLHGKSLEPLDPGPAGRRSRGAGKPWSRQF
ncbi:hypothetical protein PVAP13_9NG611142 [Panicum virgatum]|uniref:Uncharacterized protein n=1 Tax=Panicum virgatum TaxID=38727 RepID=A0A8T0MW80_PANVG|nr:hypothetical protein PVAP13_9NG611142 [Panicum virgatum]